MSQYPDRDPVPGDAKSVDAVETVIVPRARDLGGFEVRRALPSRQRQMIGPFVFFDQFGPAQFVLGEGLDVRPHPHIGLATVTYLYDGEIMHRDSLGVEQPIRPGAVNWMTAGKGIVHSERTAPDQRVLGPTLYGLQMWVGLPRAHEETDPTFKHHAEADLPRIEGEGKQVRVVAGSMFGAHSPVQPLSETLFADATLAAGTSMPIDATHEERGIYVVEGTIEIAGDRFEAHRLLVFRPGDEITVKAVTPARIAIFGGEPMDGPRYVWWNFVSSSKERIDQAKEDWRSGRFDIVPGDAEEFIPLPDNRGFTTGED